MNKVYACIDGLGTTPAVIDWGIWAAARLGAPLDFMHVLERRPRRVETPDFTGAIGFDAQDSLLQQLSDADEHHGKLAQEAGRRLVAHARERAVSAGLTKVDGRLRHGELLDAVTEIEPDARLFVLGEHHHATSTSRVHLDHHLERVVRAVQRPVLVATREGFSPPRRVVIAFDASPTSHTMDQTVARSPLLVGLPVVLLMAGTETPVARRALDSARDLLAAQRFEVQAVCQEGTPEEVLPPFVRSIKGALLVMGAYGHSRIRHLIIGSTTSTLLRLSEVPVLVLR